MQTTLTVVTVGQIANSFSPWIYHALLLLLLLLVCVCVCMCVYACVRVCVCMYVCMDGWMD